MTGLHVSVTGIDAERFAVTPQLRVELRIDDPAGDEVQLIALRCQLRIDPQRRSYTDAEAAGLRALFGERARWTQTLRPFLWTHASAVIPGFTGSTQASLPVPLSYDTEVSAGAYLHTVRNGEIPLSLMFSGTVFRRGESGFRVEQIPWDTDVSHRMPGAVWQQAMDQFFPGAGWIMVPRELLDELVRFRADAGCTDWPQALAALLDKAGVRGG